SYSFVMSPRFGICDCLYLSTADGNRSISASHAACQPRVSQATEAASIPEQTLPKIMFSISPLFAFISKSDNLCQNRLKRFYCVSTVLLRILGASKYGLTLR